MVKQNNAWMGMQTKRWALVLLAMFSLSTVMVFFMRSAFDSCSANTTNSFGEGKSRDAEIHSEGRLRSVAPNPLQFMKSKLVLLVSHELSLSGTLITLILLCFYFLFVWLLEKNKKSEKKGNQIKKCLYLKPFSFFSSCSFVIIINFFILCYNFFFFCSFHLNFPKKRRSFVTDGAGVSIKRCWR